MAKKNKPDRRRGFTIAETLITVLILLMVSAVVAAGIPAAKEAYEKVVFHANAEMLLSTSVTSLRSQLTTAGGVKVEDDGKTLAFYSSNTGFQEKIYPDGDRDGMIMVLEYSGADVGSKQITRQLVTDAAATKDLYVTYQSASCSGQMVTIEGLGVYRKSRAGTEEGPLTAVDTLVFRVMGRTAKEDG